MEAEEGAARGKGDACQAGGASGGRGCCAGRRRKEALDICVKGGAAAGRWAVEVDGPAHFLDSGTAAGAARVPMGHTVLKRRLLAAAGVVCVSVPFWEWDALKGEASEQWAYLRRSLAEAGAGKSAGEMTAAVGHLET